MVWGEQSARVFLTKIGDYVAVAWLACAQEAEENGGRSQKRGGAKVEKE